MKHNIADHLDYGAEVWIEDDPNPWYVEGYTSDYGFHTYTICRDRADYEKSSRHASPRVHLVVTPVMVRSSNVVVK